MANVVRNLYYENLVKMNRAVKQVGHNVFVVLAGEQNQDGSNRVWRVGFGNRADARAAAHSLLLVIKEGMREGWLNTDSQYNRVLHLWAEAVKSKLETQNAELLSDAEAAVKNAPPEETLVDLRGLTLKQWVLAKLNIITDALKGKFIR